MAPEHTSLPPESDCCTSCGHLPDAGHDDDCLFAEHQAAAAGDERAQDLHDTDACYWCLAQEPPVLSQCRCAECCRRLLIEVTLEDAKREPRIKELGSPIYTPPELTVSGQRELQGYLLNRTGGGGCVFLENATNHCQIYETRPLICRLFDCDGEDRQQLIDLGILQR